MLMSLCGAVQRPGCWVGNIYIFTSTGDHQLFPRSACTNLGPTAPSHPHHSLSVRFLKFCHLSYYTICSFTQRTTLSILGSLGTQCSTHHCVLWLLHLADDRNYPGSVKNADDFVPSGPVLLLGWFLGIHKGFSHHLAWWEKTPLRAWAPVDYDSSFLFCF